MKDEMEYEIELKCFSCNREITTIVTRKPRETYAVGCGNCMEHMEVIFPYVLGIRKKSNALEVYIVPTA